MPLRVRIRITRRRRLKAGETREDKIKTLIRRAERLLAQQRKSWL